MKKNLRIVSATAAALLAVAPVVASTVSSVYAADTTAPADNTTNNLDVSDGTSTPATAKDQDVNVKLTVTNASSLKVGDKPSAAKVNLTTDVGTATVNGEVNPATGTIAKVYVYEAKDVTVTNGTVTIAQNAKAVGQFEKGKQYIAVAKNVSLGGLNATSKYKVNGGEAKYGLNVGNFDVASAKFYAVDSAAQGNVYFVSKNNGNALVTADAVTLTGTSSVDSLANVIMATDTPKVDAVGDNAATVDWDKDSVVAAVQDALKAANVTVDKNGKFNPPANSFEIKLSVTASNGSTATLPITVHTTATADGAYSAYPQIGVLNAGVVSDAKAGVDTYELKGNESFNYVPINGVVNTKAISEYFGATISKANKTLVPITVDASKVNTKVAGKYPVTLTATNPAGLTSKVTFDLTVGVKGQKYATVQYEKGLSIPVYTINGNAVTTQSGTTVADGTQLAVFDTISVGGKNYTRINKKDGNEFVESQYIDGSYKPQAQSTKTVMHASYVYDKDHKRVGDKRIATYKDVTVYGEKTKLNDGTEAYMTGSNEYIDADNVDGHNVTLNHNSYVYKTSKKRANKNKLMKGETVLVYGSPVTLKSGQKFYRIGNKKFIKAVNADDPKNAK
ncbi:SLAP domain-containing protein [Lactobacillus sp. ESL0684]|uniref:SLAP domain-containing protein n=1 Tax=Lactobacillus sp. ESL0684 TaxID=2983213 RepID=UPI0023F9F26F|nr:SLAP domain-containing protein [Lactobacillus sp. ESL0684]WEV43501.1 SLAP domain-containing protein [Lactobacillus sp. ESL0684]